MEDRIKQLEQLVQAQQSQLQKINNWAKVLFVVAGIFGVVSFPELRGAGIYGITFLNRTLKYKSDNWRQILIALEIQETLLNGCNFKMSVRKFDTLP